MQRGRRLEVYLKLEHYNNMKHIISILSAVRFGQMDLQFFRREVALHPFIQDTGIMAEVDEYAVLLDNLGKITNSVRTPSFAKPRDSCEYIIGFGGWGI